MCNSAIRAILRNLFRRPCANFSVRAGLRLRRAPQGVTHPLTRGRAEPCTCPDPPFTADRGLCFSRKHAVEIQRRKRLFVCACKRAVKKSPSPLNTGNRTPKQSVIPASAEKPTRRRLSTPPDGHDLRRVDGRIGYWHKLLTTVVNRGRRGKFLASGASYDNGLGTILMPRIEPKRRQPLSANPVKLAEKCVSIFLEVQGRRPCRGSLRGEKPLKKKRLTVRRADGRRTGSRDRGGRGRAPGHGGRVRGRAWRVRCRRRSRTFRVRRRGLRRG